VKRSRPTVLYLPGIRSLAEFEFKDDEKAIRHAGWTVNASAYAKLPQNSGSRRLPKKIRPPNAC